MKQENSNNTESQKNKDSQTFFKSLTVVLSILLFIVSGFAIAVSVMFFNKAQLSKNLSDSQKRINLIEKYSGSVAQIYCGSESGTAFLTALETKMEEGVEKNSKTNSRVLYFITNYHVVKEHSTSTITLKFASKNYVFGENENNHVTLVGYDFYHDIAVLRAIDYDSNLERTPFNIEEYQNNISQGLPLVVFGNALDFAIATFDGTVSHTDVILEVEEINTSATKYVPVYQTTANINAGMSGGPIVDLNGKFIGVGTYQIPEFKGRPVVGMSYMVPANIVFNVYKQALKENLGESAENPEINKIDISFKSNTIMDMGGLGFLEVEISDGNFTIKTATPEKPTLVDGDWDVEKASIIEFCGQKAKDLSYIDLFDLFFSYVNRAVAKEGDYNAFDNFSIKIEKDGDVKELSYKNICKKSG